jgi:uncharacterized circularly permuted ATP-grasp superfamily protein/uncharacterized alpha-E superfamily protein
MPTAPPEIADSERFNELRDGSGALRPHWRPLIDQLGGEGAADRARRGIELTRRLIIENGVTYNVYADPQGADRPWALDPLPFVISAAEWRGIEAGVAQRAHLFEAMLGDLYGPQRLLAEGLAPTELAFGHPNFLWPCHGVVPRGGRRLHVYAADLARAPDGRWWVLADRTQAPSGAGYALENREIIEQVLPDVCREVGIQHIRDAFAGLRDQLLGHADGSELPLAVILTPGPYNETYFEHAYLARQLGLPLVEGSDLTVRDTTVFLKTLGGLRRVHAILRRLDDDFCDPLELRGDSALGVAGLLNAVRAGRVVLANSLGSGVLESAAWLGFLPGLSARLLGEPLRLPSVATWWCGERPALDYVTAHLDRLVIKPAYPNQHFEPVFGRNLRADDRERLLRRLAARPYAYVAQEHVALSRAPMWRLPGVKAFVKRALTIRVYALASSDGYRVMPGGLARVANQGSDDVVSAQRGGGSKDIWVLRERESATASTVVVSLPSPQRLVAPAGRSQDLPSRLVENMFWLGRYGTRCADTTRLLRATLAVRVHRNVSTHAVEVCRALHVVEEDGDPAGAVLDGQNESGIAADVRRLAWCASQVRSRLSGRYWRTVVGLQRQIQEVTLSRESPRETLERLLVALAALRGFEGEDMTRDEGWRLLRIGRRLERLQFSLALFARHLERPGAARRGEVEWLLEVCDSVNVYRARFLGAPQLSGALDLLLNDREHPCSLPFQLRALDSDLDALARSLGSESESGLAAAHASFGSAARFAAAGDAAGGAATRAQMVLEFEALGEKAARLSDRLSRRYFTHTESGVQWLVS